MYASQKESTADRRLRLHCHSLRLCNAYSLFLLFLPYRQTPHHTATIISGWNRDSKEEHHSAFSTLIGNIVTTDAHAPGRHCYLSGRHPRLVRPVAASWLLSVWLNVTSGSGTSVRTQGFSTLRFCGRVPRTQKIRILRTQSYQLVSLSLELAQNGLEGGRRRTSWTDNVKAWTSLPMPELLTMVSCMKDWKRDSAESSLMFPRGIYQSRDWGELIWNRVDRRRSKRKKKKKRKK